MRYHQISNSSLNMLRSQSGVPAKKYPYTVDVTGLSEDHLGYPRFGHELVARREWCEDICKSGHDIQPIRDEKMRLIGRRFLFENVKDAVHFKLRFDTNL